MSLREMLRSSRLLRPEKRSGERRESELFWRNNFCRLELCWKMVGGKAARLLSERSRWANDQRLDREVGERTERRFPLRSRLERPGAWERSPGRKLEILLKLRSRVLRCSSWQMLPLRPTSDTSTMLFLLRLRLWRAGVWQSAPSGSPQMLLSARSSTSSLSRWRNVSGCNCIVMLPDHSEL